MSDTLFMIHGMWGGAWHWNKYRAFPRHTHRVLGQPGWPEIADYIST